MRELSLAIEPGEKVLLLGPSGSGKSTLLAALAGVLGADEGDSEGSILVDQRPPRAGQVGLMLQDPDAGLVLSRVGDDVAFGCENLGVPRDEIWSRVARALHEVGLDLPLDASTEKLSGGQKQRLALAGLLAMQPGLLLLDEPTANLDPAGVTEVRDAVARAVADTGATLVVVEHRVGVWQEVVDRVIVLDANGGVEADGPIDEVLEARGAALAASGIWVPGRFPVVRRRATTPGARLLSTRDLVVGREKSTPVTAVDDFALDAGSLTAITGANGSGKSTLALTLGGLLEPVEGEVVAADVLADGAGPSPIRWKSRQLAARIGSVFQDPEHQFLGTTLREELGIGPRAIGQSSAEVDQLVDELLERLGLAALAAANPFTLSGGQKRRLSVGTAIATSPSVLLLDEPTFGQDALTWAALVELLRERLDAGTAIAIASHDEALVDALADHRIELAG